MKLSSIANVLIGISIYVFFRGLFAKDLEVKQILFIITAILCFIGLLIKFLSGKCYKKEN